MFLTISDFQSWEYKGERKQLSQKKHNKHIKNQYVVLFNLECFHDVLFFFIFVRLHKTKYEKMNMLNMIARVLSMWVRWVWTQQSLVCTKTVPPPPSERSHSGSRLRLWSPERKQTRVSADRTDWKTSFSSGAVGAPPPGCVETHPEMRPHRLTFVLLEVRATITGSVGQNPAGLHPRELRHILGTGQKATCCSIL